MSQQHNPSMFAGTLFMRKHHTVKCDYSGEDETIEHVLLFREIWQKVTDSKTQFNRILSICCKSEEKALARMLY